MNRRLGIVLTAASIVAVALLTTGCPDVCCNTARGGGSLAIADGPGKSHQATFGFQLVCKPTADPEAPEVSGQFEYQDHGAKDGRGKPMRVSIHGVATSAGYTETQCSSTQGMFMGTYKPQPEVAGYSGEPGNFSVAVVDNGQPGVSDGDTFTLVLSGGPFDGYSAQGTVAGGNIKTTPNETTTSGL